YVKPDAVTLLEQVAGRRQHDLHGIYFIRLHQLFARPAVAVATADDRVAQVQVIALRIVLIGRIDVDQLGGEIRVGRRRRYPQFRHHVAGDFDVVRKWRRFEDQDVRTHCERQIRRPGCDHARRLLLVRGTFEHDAAQPQPGRDALRPEWVELIRQWHQFHEAAGTGADGRDGMMWVVVERARTASRWGREGKRSLRVKVVSRD